ncbi:MAG: response regulator [Spirochaetales bacterium]|jgi:signal transduction histidine kinase/CheY-like chemotaxis protein|nr:response regulator [Spirochaetales bacterium]
MVFSIRSKVRLIVILIVIVITLSSLGVSLLFSRSRFLETIKKDLTVISAIAQEMIANEVKLTKEQTRSSANLFSQSAVEDYPAILEKEFEWYRYMALSVLDADGVIASYGDTVEPTEDFSSNQAVQRAFWGETVMATTHYVKDELVIRVWAPVEENQVLVATVPGLFLSDIIEKYRIWESGSVFILDSEGTVIAHYNKDLVLGRYNYIEIGKSDPYWKSAADFFSLMIQGGSGIATYEFFGEERLCAYTEIEGSDGWVLGVAAPSKESPLAQINQMLIISAVVFLGLGLFAASITANNIATPFEQIKEQNVRLEELKKTAETASEAKSHFLANMSHEMRTPLNAVIGLSELELGSKELTGSAYSNMEKIYISGMTLLGIINDILDISKIESGKFNLVPVEYETPSLINDTVIQNMIRIGSKPIKFRLHVEESLPLRLIGDELRVKQIFNNILSNAFKYTAEGAVDWYLSSEVDGNSVWLISSIRDTGIGIREEDIPRLFTDYNQVDIKSNRKIEGTGLGLSITKNLVELMDGGITVETEYKKGSVFSIRIRQQYVNDAVIGTELAANLSNFHYTADRRSRNEKLVRAWIPYARVLVVDDVPTNLDVAKGMLRPYGMTVDCVESGQKAIDVIQEEKIPYNAIFMDHMMPEMDGFEAVRIIRNEIATDYAKTIPIIALTANAIIGNEDLFLKNGFQAFLSKPIDIIRLDMIVNRYVRNKKLEHELAQNGKKQSPPEAPQAGAEDTVSLLAGRSLEGINFDTGLQRFDNDEKTYLGILSSYSSQIQSLFEKIQSCTEETLQNYKVAMHSLKSTSYTVGATQIGRMAEGLETAASSADMVYIKSSGGALVAALEKLMPRLRAFLEETREADQKPVQPAPDPELLKKLLKASAVYDMEQLDAVMEKLERYRYEAGGELVDWLRKQIDRSELENIRERLTRNLE